MIAIVTVLIALPLGYFCRARSTAFLAYVAAFAHVYTFQTANLVMEWVNGSGAAFPLDSSQALLGGTLSYFAFTSVIYVVGFLLVLAGQRLRVRHARRQQSVDLASA